MRSVIGFGKSSRKRIPIGYEDFKLLIDGGFYYVDKTMLIYDLLHYGGQNNLITRPRRFGKTLNFSMLKYFFDIAEKDNAYLFDDKEIMRHKDEIAPYRNAFPLISLSMKSAKQGSYGRALYSICMDIREQFIKFSYVLDSDKLTDVEKKDYRRILECETGDEMIFGTALKKLSMALSKYYGENAVIFIDEYDMPLEDAYLSGYYDEMVSFIRTLFESALKTNPSLQFSVITGSLHILNESIFSAINNVEIDSIRNNGYAEHFGFTDKEIRELSAYYGLEDKQGDFLEWYGGYRFGNCNLYNPWSVLHQIKQWSREPYNPPKSQWKNMSYTEFINGIMKNTHVDMKQPIEDLLTGRAVYSKIYNSISFNGVENDLAAIYTFMYYIGYITIADSEISPDGVYSLKIPNLEIRGWYDDMIKHIGIESLDIPASDEVKKEEDPVDKGNPPHPVKDDEDDDRYSLIIG